MSNPADSLFFVFGKKHKSRPGVFCLSGFFKRIFPDTGKTKNAASFMLAAVRIEPNQPPSNPGRLNAGAFYKAGFGAKENPAGAIKWFRKATQNLPESQLSQFMLGYCYETVYGVKADRNKAIDLYQKAAAQGHAEARKKLDERSSW